MTEPTTPAASNRGALWIAGAVVVAALIIGGAIFIATDDDGDTVQTTPAAEVDDENGTDADTTGDDTTDDDAAQDESVGDEAASDDVDEPSDEGNDAAPDPQPAASDEAALCDAYFQFLDDPTPDTANRFLDGFGDSMPTGVYGAVLDVAEGREADLGPVAGYFGPVCDDDSGSDSGVAASNVTEACLGLHEAYIDGDRDEALRFTTEDAVVDELFSVPFSPPANRAVVMNDFGECFYTVPQHIAEVLIADSDLEAFVFEVVWRTTDEFFADEDRARRYDEAS